MKTTKFTKRQLKDLIIWLERYESVSPNKVVRLSKKYPGYYFFEFDDMGCDNTWVLAKNKQMAADLINERELIGAGDKTEIFKVGTNRFNKL